jgi:hypothetical protein
MKYILLTQGKKTLVDDVDFELYGDLKWQYMNGYAGRTTYKGGSRKGAVYETEWLHRLVAQTPEGLVGDHINGNPLDNRRKNLRNCTQRQNLMNTSKKNTNKSGVKGVSYHKKSGKWVAQIYENGKKVHLGVFGSIEEAGEVYQEKARLVFGEFSRV